MLNTPFIFYRICGIILCWICCSIFCWILARRAWRNQFGWGERILAETMNCFVTYFIVSVVGPIGFLIVIACSNKYCFMSKEKSLRLIDEADLKNYGYYISRQIAFNENRLPEGTNVKIERS